MLPHECAYPTKRRFLTRDDAVKGAERIREGVKSEGGKFNTLYPYECPRTLLPHWHLSSKPQSVRVCPSCGTEQPAWFSTASSREWVIYAHGQCQTTTVAAT